MRRGVNPWLFLAAVIGGAVVLTVVYELTQRYSALPVYGPATVIDGREQAFVVPAYEFIAQDGETFSSSKLTGKVAVTNFFFTSCPTICPQMMRNMQSVHELFRSDPGVAFVSFTVDPKRDNPERLKMYAEALNADMTQWRFLTGDKKKIYALARNGFFVSATDGDGGDHDFIHSENLVLVDGEGHLRGYYNGLDPESVEQLSRDISKLKKERS
jgi:protein SCO1/2